MSHLTISVRLVNPIGFKKLGKKSEGQRIDISSFHFTHKNISMMKPEAEISSSINFDRPKLLLFKFLAHQ